MANTIDFILTTAADELISKVLSGKTLNFTRMAVGDGFSYDINVAKGFKNVVNEVLSLDITKKETLSPSSVRITSVFKNTDAQKEFYYREVGLYAQDPDTGEEVLYAYGNRNDAAELITPTGSNVVTKQLVFIISVGDSANVTFNVNADVYALQEDMLDVQAEIKALETSKANKNLSNTGMITNCLLEVPQRIKYELVDGVLTIKAGSVLIVPYGLVDLTGSFPVGSTFLSTKHKVVDAKYNNNTFFVWVELTENITVTEKTTESGVERWLFYDFGNKNLGSQRNATSNTTGNSSNTDGLLCYRTDLNKVVLYSGANILGQNCSLPLLIVKSNGSYVHENVVQVFNGMGYIGSHAWIDKGVKGLVPNGRNSDGTLNNIEAKTNELMFVGVGYGTGIVNIAFNSSTFGLNDYYLDELNNVVRVTTDDVVRTLCIAGKLGVTSGVITSLTLYTPFKAISKSSDKPWLSGLSMPSEKYIELELGEQGATYTAPANGWFAIRKTTGITNGSFTLAVWNPIGPDEIYRTTMCNHAEIAEIAFAVPVSKGQIVAVDYDATGQTEYFRFIYAQGEVN